MRVLAEEACRIADRLERLDGLLRGDSQEWISFRGNDDGTVVVVVDKLLDTTRQQELALKQLISEIRQATAKAGGPAQQTGGTLDELQRKRDERRQRSG